MGEEEKKIKGKEEAAYTEDLIWSRTRAPKLRTESQEKRNECERGDAERR